MHVILRQQPESYFQVIDVVEYQSAFGRVAGLGFQEGVWVVTPVSEGIEVVRGVVAVVEAEAVGLGVLVELCMRREQVEMTRIRKWARSTYRYIN